MERGRHPRTIAPATQAGVSRQKLANAYGAVRETDFTDVWSGHNTEARETESGLNELSGMNDKRMQGTCLGRLTLDRAADRLVRVDSRRSGRRSSKR